MQNIIIILLCLFTMGCSSTGLKVDLDSDKSQVLEIFSAADNQTAQGLVTYLENVDENIVLMPHNHPAVIGKSAYEQHIIQNWQGGTTMIKHELIEMTSFKDVVIARGRAIGTFRPNDSQDVFAFETKNMFVFKRDARGNLKVWQIIFNMQP